MNFIWATRGRVWGFRFLDNAGYADPLPIYEAAFARAGDEPCVCHQAGDTVALRFLDPEERRDASGRIIPHEFVLFGWLASRVRTVDDGIAVVWPLAADRYAAEWDRGDSGGFG